MAAFDIVALEIVLLDLVTCLGDLVNIGIQSHSHFAADAAGMCLLCMEQFGTLLGQDSVIIDISTREEVLRGIGTLLLCIKCFATFSAKEPKSSRLCSDFVLRSCVNKIWLALSYTARGATGYETRQMSLELIDILLENALLPEFGDSVLSTLAAALSTPDSEYWAHKLYTSELSPHDAIARCLDHDVAALLIRNETPPTTGLSDYASIVRLNLEGRTAPDISTAVCNCFAKLVFCYPSAATLAVAVQLIPYLKQPDFPAHSAVVHCLQQAVLLAEEDDVVNSFADPNAPTEATTNAITVLRKAKRPRIMQAFMGVSGVDSEIERLLWAMNDALGEALALIVPQPGCTQPSGWLPEHDSMLYAAAMMRIKLAKPNVFDWTCILEQFSTVLTTVLECSPHATAAQAEHCVGLPNMQEYPTFEFVRLWLVAVKLVADFFVGLNPTSLEPHWKKFTEFLSIGLCEEFRQAAGCDRLSEQHRSATSQLVCVCLHTLAIPYCYVRSRISYSTLSGLLRPQNIAQNMTDITIEAVRVSPCAAIATPDDVRDCFKKLSVLLLSLPDVMEAEELAELQIAIAHAVGLLCCCLAASHPDGIYPTNTRQRPYWRCCPQCDAQSQTSSCHRVPIVRHLGMFTALLDGASASRATASFARAIARGLRHAKSDELKSEDAKYIVRRWLQLLLHADYQVRTAVTASIGVLMEDNCLCIKSVRPASVNFGSSPAWSF
jgi:hypothetical protein